MTLLDVVLTVCTGGLWLIVVLIRNSNRKVKFAKMGVQAQKADYSHQLARDATKDALVRRSQRYATKSEYYARKSKEYLERAQNM